MGKGNTAGAVVGEGCLVERTSHAEGTCLELQSWKGPCILGLRAVSHVGGDPPGLEEVVS